MNKMTIKRSPLFYVGDKYKLIEKIKEHFPENIKRFIEPFTGGGSVFLNVDADKYLLNDIDSNVYEIHRFLLKRASNPDKLFREIYEIIKEYGFSRSYFEDIVPLQLKKRWKKTYYARYNKDAYNKLKEAYNASKKKNPLILYTLLIYGFNRMLRFNGGGKFNLPVGNVDFNKNVYNSLKEYSEISRNRNIAWHNLDFTPFIRSIKFQKDDFVYLDPPYLISFSEYNKLWNSDKEKELLKLLEHLNRKGVKFAISNVVLHKGMKNEIFSKWMGKYKIHKIDSNYISYHNNSKKQIMEVLITNYGKA
jgi:DNA adenine methylase